MPNTDSENDIVDELLVQLHAHRRLRHARREDVLFHARRIGEFLKKAFAATPDARRYDDDPHPPWDEDYVLCGCVDDRDCFASLCRDVLRRVRRRETAPCPLFDTPEISVP